MGQIVGHVYEETNYEMFIRLPDNRDVLSGRLNKLVASISVKYVLNPIIVNEKMEIIDGQGRYDALKLLGKPIHYVISPGATSDDCRRMNKYNTKWNVLDFVKSFARAGNQSYAILLAVCEKTGYNIYRVLRLANIGNYSKAGSGMNIVESGDLSFNEYDAKYVIKLKGMIDDIIDALQFKAKPNDTLITGIKVMVETPHYQHLRMLSNCKKCRSSFAQMAQLGDQLVELERIYNYHTKQGQRLYFSDYMRNRGRNIRDYDNCYSPYKDKDISSLKMIGEE